MSTGGDLVGWVMDYLLTRPDARVVDVMADFDLSDSDALAVVREARRRLAKVRRVVIVDPEQDVSHE